MQHSTVAVGVVMPLLRGIILGIGATAALAATLAWAVRTRRLSPFSIGARFSRRWIDPLLRPVDRVVRTTGGHASAAPWWGLVVVAVAGAVALTMARAALGVATEIQWALGQPLGMLLLLIAWAFGIVRFALIVRVLASWLPVSAHSRWIRWTYPLTEWILRPLRAVVPPIGMFDITPIVAYFALVIVQALLHLP